MTGFMTSPRYAEVVRDTDGRKVVSAISPMRPSWDICVVGRRSRHDIPPETVVENKSFILIVLTLIVLIVVALWQFYSLAWGDGPSQSYHVRSPSVAAALQ